MELFLAPHSLPFAIAAVMLIALTVIEMACLLIGFSLGEVVDKAWPDDMAGLMSWLNVGGVPVLILLMIILGIFAMTGFVLQAVASAIWTPLPALIAIPTALAGSVPTIRVASRWVARLVPRDESYAVDLADLVGRTAEVTVGPLDQALPGRVRLKDRYGNWHVLRAKAAAEEAPIAIGAQVLLVDRNSDIFIAIPVPSDLDVPQTS